MVSPRDSLCRLMDASAYNCRPHAREAGYADPQALGIFVGGIRSGGLANSSGQRIDPGLSWKDIKWLRSQTDLPIGLKGIQSVEDAKRAVEAGVDAIILSNHG